jgi:hypothetical protein
LVLYRESSHRGYFRKSLIRSSPILWRTRRLFEIDRNFQLHGTIGKDLNGFCELTGGMGRDLVMRNSDYGCISIVHYFFFQKQ